jgi:hypothetical protein
MTKIVSCGNSEILGGWTPSAIAFSLLQSFGDNHLPLKARPNFDRLDFCFVVLARNSDLITYLQLYQGGSAGPERNPADQ